MNITLVDSNTDFSKFGLYTRKSRPGPEEDLLQNFIKNFDIALPKGDHMTLFKEPCIESGRPDLVCVVWDRNKLKDWTPERLRLTSFDLRLLHFLVCEGRTRLDDLDQVFTRKLNASLDRLVAAEMISMNLKTVQARTLSRIYAVKHIYAIEAKISQLQNVLGQASLNLWFAQTSFVLVPNMPRKSTFHESANRLGVEVLCGGDRTFDMKRVKGSQARPVSYASWLFNEWVWRMNFC